MLHFRSGAYLRAQASTNPVANSAAPAHIIGLGSNGVVTVKVRLRFANR